jgi:hypothetical protein
MGSLEEVDGGFNVESTNGTFECSSFKKLKSDGVIRGTYKCDASTSDPTTANGKSGTSSSTSSSSTSATSSGAASSLAVPATGLAALFLAFAQFL